MRSANTSTTVRQERAAMRRFVAALRKEERDTILALDTPLAIQAFLDSIPYSVDHFYRCPARVLRDRVAHCFDGALFAAAALRRLGHPPLLVDLVAERDDDHLLAIFRRGRFWGAIAKSNFVGIRYREPIYKSLRELVMTYFEPFYNVLRQKTLRGYTVPLNLVRGDPSDWMTSDEQLEEIADRLDRSRHIPILSREQVAELALVDERSFVSGMQGADAAGLWVPPAASGSPSDP
jgi:hypothetical protein